MLGLFFVFLSATVYLKEFGVNDTYEFTYQSGVYDTDGVAFAKYDPDFYNSGWDYLWLKTNRDKKYSDYTIAAGAGYLEGYLNQKMIYLRFPITWVDTNYTIPEYISRFFREQREWMNGHVVKNADDNYWKAVKAVVLQQEYVVNGYNDASSESEKLTQDQFECLYNQGIHDLLMMKTENRPDIDSMSSEEILSQFYEHTKCSAIFKITADMKEIYYGHTTWSDPGTLLRTQKEYELNFHENPSVKSFTTIFPSYPGVTNSIDDMYSMKETKMVSIETTNAVFDLSLYDLLTHKSVPEWARIILANRLSDNGIEWMKVFETHNDGMYNNQWMVLDLKLFTPGEELPEKLFVVGEQIPGDFIYADVTQQLERGYWPSYNVPYFEKIFNKTGYRDQLEKHPEMKVYFDYQTCVRSQLMRKYQTNIESMDEMEKFIRYNNYLKDSLELNNPALAIAARHDLDLEGARCHMSTDAKISSTEFFLKDNSWRIISGPPYGGDSDVPPFKWSTTKNCDLESEKHIGMPDQFKFDWVSFKGED